VQPVESSGHQPPVAVDVGHEDVVGKNHSLQRVLDRLDDVVDVGNRDVVVQVDDRQVELTLAEDPPAGPGFRGFGPDLLFP
jgi:hypothetical protein